MSEFSIDDGEYRIAGRYTYRSRRTIQVEITSGIYPFRTSLTMQVPIAQSPEGLLGKAGAVEAEKFLRLLGRLCRFIEGNRDVLIAGYRDFTALVARTEYRAGLSDFMFDMTLKSLKRELSAGKIGPEEFEREIASSETLNGRYHHGYRALRDEFFAQTFPFKLPSDVEEQVLIWLRWEDFEVRGWVAETSS